MLNSIAAFWSDDGGQDTVEYSLMVALVAVLAAIMFPPNIGAIARICNATEVNLYRAEHAIPH